MSDKTSLDLTVLVATMFQKDYSILDKMKIESNAVIVNQANRNAYDIFSYKGYNVKYISTSERGLSKSRNLAMKNAETDICMIADDDVFYKSEYKEIILKEYLKNPQYDVIAFGMPVKNRSYQKKIKEGPLNYLSSLKINSVRITFRLNKIKEKGIEFNELFGAGSEKYSMGEENIFLYDCLRNGLKILYVDKDIGYVNLEDRESTWFRNKFDKKYLQDRGALSYELGKAFHWLFNFGFIVKNYKKIREDSISITEVFKNIKTGKNEYKKIMESKK